MSVASLSQDRLIGALADLGHGFVLTDLGRTADCLSIESLRAKRWHEAGVWTKLHALLGNLHCLSQC